mmetsp:Transcript_30750/g.30234  ORF Transcript_30750/g.30234 Transcript_30750/m.30234 type:complete len:206 (+) Transcript_30750:2532-3149(+)
MMPQKKNYSIPWANSMHHYSFMMNEYVWQFLEENKDRFQFAIGLNLKELNGERFSIIKALEEFQQASGRPQMKPIQQCIDTFVQQQLAYVREYTFQQLQDEFWVQADQNQHHQQSVHNIISLVYETLDVIQKINEAMTKKEQIKWHQPIINMVNFVIHNVCQSVLADLEPIQEIRPNLSIQPLIAKHLLKGGKTFFSFMKKKEQS